MPIFLKFLISFIAGVVSGSPVPAVHPIHVSVTEIHHNPVEKTLEISCKLFTDDFENVLQKTSRKKVDLINPSDNIHPIIENYLAGNLAIATDKKKHRFDFIGFENDKEATYCYLQINDISSVKEISVVNSLLYDMFNDQLNIIHLSAGRQQKSTKLEYPRREISIRL